MVEKEPAYILVITIGSLVTAIGAPTFIRVFYADNTDSGMKQI